MKDYPVQVEDAYAECRIEKLDDISPEHLERNVDAKIRNPLSHLSREQVLLLANQLAHEHDLLEFSALLEKGALVAQDPEGFEGLPELDEVDKEAIRQEKLHKWRQPKALYLTVILCSLAAAVQGWDQTGTNGANLTFPHVFGISSQTGIDPWIVGLINAAPYYSAAMIGCWLSDPLNNRFGRRTTIFISAIFCLFPVIGSAFSQTWLQLLITRILMGIGMGCKASTAPVFAAENCPASIRGGLVMSWQMWTAFGIFLGLSANLAVFHTGSIAWRLELGSAFIPAVPLAIGIFFCPESPRWYMKKGRYKDAFSALKSLRNTPIQAARDLCAIHAQLAHERKLTDGNNYATRFIQLFTVPRIRRATLASFTVMIAQQMCGINIVAFYSSTIFAAAGFTEFQALLGSWGYGIIGFVFAFPAIWTIDTFGRRSLLLFTFPQMTWTLLAAGLSNLIPQDNKAHLALVALFIYMFTAFYSPGEGPVPFTYSAEVFPLSHREVGMAWAVATCFFWSSILSLTFPTLLASFGAVGAFGFYAGLNFLALIMIFLWVPETKQLTLEELDYVFAVPTRTFMKYQIAEALPYFIKRWILWRRDATLRQLFQLEELERHE
ncbi:sugar transporter [Penicillium maclennaniae]|uniref:sugar transporter n=1 Tax=Penicillium maclennaniae TaxID=1343394 RepID=UPI00253FE736|nr:sugar transporter [Penicillium maclennaniae]KAJ5669908.1 sugar transporter [Penicillium maclennaniae]